MVASSGYLEFLVEQLAPLGRVSARRMFGKTGIFCHGVMLGLVSDDALYLRVDDGNRDALRGAGPALSYVKGGRSIDLAYWRVPDQVMDEADELLVWARAALGAAMRVAAKRPR